MERCTAYPASIVAIMLAKGQTEKGALRLETGVSAELFMKEFLKRDFNLVETIKTDM